MHHQFLVLERNQHIVNKYIVIFPKDPINYKNLKYLTKKINILQNNKIKYAQIKIYMEKRNFRFPLSSFFYYNLVLQTR